ncbi:MAG: hypothetical protein ACI8PZ_003612 [Myxococcota bacterium]|jgi:hypothetical protein
MRTWTLALLIACGGGDKDSGSTDTASRSEGSTPYCGETISPLGWDDTAPDGTVPSEAITAFEGEHATEFAYRSTGVAGLTLSIVRAGEPEWVDQEPVYPGTGSTIAIGVVCWDQVRMPITVSFTTDDGGFAETWEQTVSVPGSPYASTTGGDVLRHTVDPAALMGSWTLDEGVDPSEYDYLELTIAGSITAGRVDVNGQQTSGDAVSFGIVQQVGTWGGIDE